MQKLKKENNVILRGIKTKIYPDENQKKIIDRYIDLYRFTYNLALELQNDQYEHGSGNTIIDVYSMNILLSKLRNSGRYPWLQELPLNIARQAVLANCTAFKNYLTGVTYYPRFKSKKKSKKSFDAYARNVSIFSDIIKIAGIGKIQAKYHRIPLGSKIYKGSISFDGENYWFSCSIKKEVEPFENFDSEPIGIDIGKKKLIVASDGSEYYLSDTSKLIKRLQYQNKALQRDYLRYKEEAIRTRSKYEDVLKSKNHEKRLRAARKTEFKILNKKMYDIHLATRRIIDKNPSAIVIEDLVATKFDREDWFKDRFYIHAHEVRRQIEYKAEEKSIPVFLANKYYPSSQICSNCGHRRSEPLKPRNRTFSCPHCGFSEDRDLNAAINLKKLAYQKDGVVYRISAS